MMSILITCEKNIRNYMSQGSYRKLRMHLYLNACHCFNHNTYGLNPDLFLNMSNVTSSNFEISHFMT